MHCRFKNRIVRVLLTSNVAASWVSDQLQSFSALRDAVLVPLNRIFLIQHNCWHPGPQRASGNFSTDVKGQDVPKCGYFSLEGIRHRSPVQALTFCCLLAAVLSGFFCNFCNFWALQLENTDLSVSHWVTNAFPGSVKGLTLGIQDCSVHCLGIAAQILGQDTIKNKTEQISFDTL